MPCKSSLLTAFRDRCAFVIFRHDTPAVALLTETFWFGHNNFGRDDIMFMVENEYLH